MSSSTAMQKVAQHYIDRNAFCGIEWAVKHRGDLVESGQAGLADHDAGKPMPEHPIYRIYSMTKPIVSIAALILIERNQLQLYDPVAAFIPAFGQQTILDEDGSRSPSVVPPTVEHLLTHRAGLSYDFLPDCPVANLYREAGLIENANLSLEELATILGEMPIIAEPGTRWKYSYATDVLARVIEVACDRSIADVLDDLVLKPLGMEETSFKVAEEQRSRLMTMYGAQSLSEIMNPSGEQTLQVTDVDSTYPVDSSTFHRGGLGLYSTTSDYLRFCEFLHSGHTADGRRLLSSAMVNMMWTNRIPESYPMLQVGLNPLPGYGWNLFGRVMVNIGQSMALTGLGEGGWAGAGATYFWVDRANQLSGVVMTQYLGSILPMSSEMRAACYVMLDDFNHVKS